MVASIDALTTRKIDYYLASYYLELDGDRLRGPTPDSRGAERKSLSGWLESAATARFGLSGRVKPRDFRDMLGGARDGRPLVQNEGKKNRQVGWDLTLSMSKGESLIAAFGSDEHQKAVLAAHEAGVRAVHEEIQKLARTRVGKGGGDREPVSIPVAFFTHFDSREHDPNFHTHLVLPNVGLRLGKTASVAETGTVLSHPFYQWKMCLGQLYRNIKALEMQRSLGVEIDVDRKTGLYEIRGFSKHVLAGFSTRRNQLLSALGSGSYSAKAADAASLKTRRNKGHLTVDGLSAHWEEKAKVLGFTGPDLLKVLHRRRFRELSPARAERVVGAAIGRAIDRITEQRSHFSRRELLKDTMALTLKDRVDPKLVFRGVDRALADRRRMVELGEHKHEIHYSTRQILERERVSLEAAKALSERTSRSVSGRDLEATIKANPRLNAGQLDALRVAATGPDLTIISGLAGVGKTTAQKAIIEALRRSGERVICVAPTNRAVEEMKKRAEKSGVEGCYTVDRLVYALRQDILDTLGHHARMLIREAFKMGTWKQTKIPITKKTTIIVDEASMAENAKLGFLIEEARKAGSRVIVCGDKGQLPAIGQGGMLSELEARRTKGQRATLTEVIRQRAGWARAAIGLMGMGGDAGEVLGEFEKHQLVTVSPTRSEAMQALVEKWAKHGVKDPSRHQIYAATNEECDALNNLAQARRKAAGQLGRIKITLGAETFHSGDRLVFTVTRKSLGIHASAFGTVKSIDPFARRVTVTLDEAVLLKGKLTQEISFSAYNFTAAKRGYAVTAHRGQGMTIEGGDAYILAGGRTEHREMAYVKISRAEENTHIFVDELEAGPELSRLARQFGESRAKLMAHTILRENTPQARRDGLGSPDRSGQAACVPEQLRDEESRRLAR